MKNRYWSPNKAKEALKRINEQKKEWLTLREVAEIMQQSQGWVWLKVTRDKKIPTKRDITKGKNKIYRLVSIDELRKFTKDYLEIFK